jgi:hypothetical protein
MQKSKNVIRKVLVNKNKWVHLLQRSNMVDEAYNVLATMDNLHCDMLLAERELELDNATEAAAWMTSVLSRQDQYDPWLTNEIDRFEDWYDIKSELITVHHGDWSTLTAPQIINLEALAENYATLGGKRAMAVLNAYYEADYFIPPAYGGNAFEWRNLDQATLLTPSSLKIYPNPATTILNIELDYSSHTSKPDKLIIYNTLGQVVEIVDLSKNVEYKSLDVRQWTPGLYHYTLISQNTSLDRGQFEVIR